MKFYETSFISDAGFIAKADIFHPEKTTSGRGFVSFSLRGEKENEYQTPICIRMPYAMAAKAERIAAAINEIMAEDDSANTPMVEAFPQAAE